MKKLSVLAIAASFAVFAACSKKTNSAVKESGSSTNTVSAEKAAGYFATSCSGCHGADGDSGRAPDLSKLTASRDHVIYDITNGEGHMPAFKGTYSKEEIAAIADYVMALRK